jgi:cytochrome P450
MRDAILSLSDIDLSDPDFFVPVFPHDAFALLRREAPVFFNSEPDGPGFWVISRYADIHQVHRDVATFSSELGGISLEDLDSDQIESRKSMIDIDSPRHHQLRAMINKRFAPRAVTSWEELVRSVTTTVLDEALSLGEFDFVERVSAEIPAQVFGEILGVPKADRRRVVALGDQVIGGQDPDYKVTLREDARLLQGSNPASREIIDVGRQLAADRGDEPQDDIVTRLAREGLTQREYDNYFLMLVVGGSGGESTRHTITQGLLALLDRPEQANRLRDDPTLLGNAVEEMLRWSSPLNYFRRTATRDVELGGRTIAAGDKVTTWLASGNRDGDVFSDPDSFDIARSPNRHMAFGPGGIHHCIGAPLARLQIRIVFEQLLARVSRVEVLDEPRRLRSNAINGIKHLPVRME